LVWRLGTTDDQVFAGNGDHWGDPVAGIETRERVDCGVCDVASRGDHAGESLELAAADCVVCELRAAAGALVVLL